MGKKKIADGQAVAVPQQKQPAPVDIQNDEYRGMGGSYIIDPATGKRTRVEGPDVGADNIRPEAEPAIDINQEEKADESE